MPTLLRNRSLSSAACLPLPSSTACLHLRLYSSRRLESWDNEIAYVYLDNTLVWSRSFNHAKDGDVHCGSAGWVDGYDSQRA